MEDDTIEAKAYPETHSDGSRVWTFVVQGNGTFYSRSAYGSLNEATAEMIQALDRLI
jgi:hypothetical protein